MKLLNEEAIAGLKALQEKTGKDICDRLVKLFVETTPEAFKKMDQALKAESFEDLSREAHTLKSSSGNLGAVAMSEQSMKIEHAITQEGCQDVAQLTEMVRSLQKIFPETCDEIKKAAA